MELMVGMDPTIPAMSQAKRSTTIVRTAVATSESVWRMPHFARMDVMPAKRAEPQAARIHMRSSFSSVS